MNFEAHLVTLGAPADHRHEMDWEATDASQQRLTPCPDAALSVERLLLEMERPS